MEDLIDMIAGGDYEDALDSVDSLLNVTDGEVNEWLDACFEALKDEEYYGALVYAVIAFDVEYLDQVDGFEANDVGDETHASEMIRLTDELKANYTIDTHLDLQEATNSYFVFIRAENKRRFGL